MSTSRFPGFYRQTLEQRRDHILKNSALKEVSLLDASSLSADQAALMVENAIGTFALPYAIAVNFLCNDKDVLVPMVVEEPSVVAALSNMAQLVRRSGGFASSCDKSVMIGQIQIPNVQHPEQVIATLEANKEILLKEASSCHPKLQERGGGVRGIEFRSVLYDEPGEESSWMVVAHFFLDCVDAMGANMINTIAEKLAPHISQLTKLRVGLRILSNFATKRLARASCRIPVEMLSISKGNNKVSGLDVAQGIVDAYRFAYADPWRAATHNKGIMNGIDALAIATGNDWRAIEAGAHTWAARSGQYRSLSKWSLKRDEDEHMFLVGSIELPMQVGIVGGSIKIHPQVSASLKLMGNPRASELSGLMAMVGLAQNLGALRALATEGIQTGHMKMHARNLAFQAGANPEEIPTVVEQLSSEHCFTEARAKEIIAELRS
ncbi:MAG: hydroxymethylglutaryl-CoA reductase, degradative [Proteobacteria bacterium]|nr:hydroxymethylglutaryl-CoA reductase, degradative [Pseudomonadota bacterium]